MTVPPPTAGEGENATTSYLNGEKEDDSKSEDDHEPEDDEQNGEQDDAAALAGDQAETSEPRGVDHLGGALMVQEGENAITGMNINGEEEGESEADKVDEIRKEEDDQGRATHVLYDKETDEFNYKSLANAEPTTISPHELGLHPHLVYRWFLNACKRAPGQWLKVDEIIDLDVAALMYTSKGTWKGQPNSDRSTVCAPLF